MSNGNRRVHELLKPKPATTNTEAYEKALTKFKLDLASHEKVHGVVEIAWWISREARILESIRRGKK